MATPLIEAAVDLALQRFRVIARHRGERAAQDELKSLPQWKALSFLTASERDEAIATIADRLSLAGAAWA